MATSYTFHKGPDTAGGHVNSLCVHPTTIGLAGCGGDIFGPHTTTTAGGALGGDGWQARLGGTNNNGQIYMRAQAFSLKTPGLMYCGIGTLKQGSGAGQFATVTPSDWKLTTKTTTWGFGTGFATNAAALRPRAVGNLIQVDFDGTNEYVYFLSGTKLVRYNAQTGAFTTLNDFGATLVPVGAWASLGFDPVNLAVYPVTYGSTGGASFDLTSHVWFVQGSGGKTLRTAAGAADLSVTQITTAPTVINDINYFGGGLYAAAGKDTTSGVYTISNNGQTWSLIGSLAAGSGSVSASVDGTSATNIYVGLAYLGSGGTPAGQGIARWNGSTWTWIVPASAINTAEWGTTEKGITNRTYWLASGTGLPGRAAFDVEMLRIQHNAATGKDIVYAVGSSPWVSVDSGASWRPAVLGLNGGECNTGLNLSNTTSGTVNWGNFDWGTLQSTDHWATVTARPVTTQGATVPTTVNHPTGWSIAFANGAWDIITPSGSIANDYFRSSMCELNQWTVDDTNNYVYITQFTGATLYGFPSTSQPLQAPVLSQPTVTGTSVTASWTAASGGTSPYTYQVSYDGGAFATPSSGSGGLSDTRTLASGNHTLVVKVTDSAAATATSNQVTFSLSASSLIAGLIITPQSSSTQTLASLTSTWNAATGGTSPYSYQVSYDSGAFTAATGTLSDTHTFTNGAHTVQVKAVDSTNATALSSKISFTISALTPGAITAPTPNEVFLTNTITTTWNPATGGTPPYSYKVQYDSGSLITPPAGASLTSKVFVCPDGQIHVFDPANNWAEIETHTGLATIDGIRGIAASPTGDVIYFGHGSDGQVAGTGSLMAWNTVTKTVIYDVTYAHGVDQIAVTTDGTQVWMPDGEGNSGSVNWFVKNASNGAAIATITATGATAPHNTMAAPKSGNMYLGPRHANQMQIWSQGRSHIKTLTSVGNPAGTGDGGMRPFTFDSNETLLFVTYTKFLGFGVIDIATDTRLFLVDMTTSQYGSFSYVTTDPLTTPAHGISMSPDETQLALIDMNNSRVHFFDITGLMANRTAPVRLASPHTNGATTDTPVAGNQSPCAYDCARYGWVTHSWDGKYLYAQDVADVFDTSTHTKVGNIPIMANTRHGTIEVVYNGTTPIYSPTHFGIGRKSFGQIPTGSGLTDTTTLVDGTHTFRVQATDSVPTIATTPAVTFQVGTSLTMGAITFPANNQNIVTPTVTITWNAAIGGTAPYTYLMSVDSGPYSSAEVSGTSATHTFSPGSHVVQVKVTDSVGNTSLPVSVTFIEGTSLTVPVITTPPNPITTATYVTSWTASTGGAGGITYKINYGNGFVTPTSGATGLSDSHTFPDGTYTVQVQATDLNNVSVRSTAITYLVEATPPAAPTIDSGPTVSSGGTTSSTTATFSFHETGNINPVTFTGQITGGSAATLTSPVTYSGLTAGTYAFTLRATDTVTNLVSAAATWTWTVSPVSLPATPTITSGPSLGGASANQTVTITNTGTANLTIGTLTISGANASQFVISADNASGKTVIPGSSVTVVVTFQPASAGTFTATLNIPNNANTLDTLLLTGSGVATGTTSASITPSSINYGPILFGTTSGSHTISAQNTGTLPITFDQIVLTSAFTFNVVSDQISLATLLPNGILSLALTYTPGSGSEVATGDVAITYNSTSSTGNVAHVTLQGSGKTASPLVSLSSTTLNFPDTNTGVTSSALTITVTNTGTANLVMGTAGISGTNASNFAKTSDNVSGQTITPGSNRTVGITFTPSAVGARSATLSFNDNALDSPQRVALTGNGTTAVPIATLTPSSMSFGTVKMFATSSPQTLTITNTGTSNLVVSTVALTGTNPLQFAIQTDNASGQTITPGGNRTVVVVFKPKRVGIQSANISVADNAGGSPQTIPLGGTGSVASVQPLAKTVYAYYYPNYGLSPAEGFGSEAYEGWGGTYPSPLGTAVTHTFAPPTSIASDYYPADYWSGATGYPPAIYSSSDPIALKAQCVAAITAGINVLIVSWKPPPDRSDTLITALLSAALAATNQTGLPLFLSFMIEPYATSDFIDPTDATHVTGGRATSNVWRAINYLNGTYGAHSNFYRTARTGWHYAGRVLGANLFFVNHPEYDYLTGGAPHASIAASGTGWQTTTDDVHNPALVPLGGLVLAESSYAPNYVDAHHFDGGFSYLSLPLTQTGIFNQSVFQFSRTYELGFPPTAICVPGIAPGYSGWRTQDTLDRRFPRNNGLFYDTQWNQTLNGVALDDIAITSWNDWQHGTQIEAATNQTTGTGI